MSHRFLMGSMIVVCMAAIAGCTGAEGECTYDTDCTGQCKICDTSAHECVDDPACVNIIEGRCASDSDCDPLQERCDNGYCVPRGDGGDPGPGDDGPPDGDSGPDEIPEVCLNPDLNCSVPQTETEISQGRDRDMDDWGECCDCDETNAAVNPSRSEAVYNCKDDDCNPNTRDDDLDRDNYGSILRGCGPGSDCNDARDDVHPGATEYCDGVDNDCNGEVDMVDGESVCVTVDCTDVSGPHYLEPHCLAFNPEDVNIVQDQCSISFLINEGEPDEFTCTGTLDALNNLYVECGGIVSVQCTAKISLTQQWKIDCSADCYFFLIRTSAFTNCDHFADTDCTTSGQHCGMACNAEDGEQVCVNSIPGGRQPGFFCDPDEDVDCTNEFCHDSTCAAPCRNEADCTTFSGTSCQAITYMECVNPLVMNACIPVNAGETTCNRSADCDPDSNRICTYRQRAAEVATVCRTQAGSADAGDTCDSDADCKSGFCVCGTALCTGGNQGKCSEVCTGNSDCPASAECGSVTIADLGGTDRAVSACVWGGGSCGRDADCPTETPVCTVGVNATHDALITFCTGSNGMFEDPNTGEDCESDWECYGFWCSQEYPRYCNAVCTTDADCAEFDGVQSCSPGGPDGDEDCDLNFLCESDGQCMRIFECRANVFGLGIDEHGQEIVDAVDMCRPQKRQCFINEDCRAGEACKVNYTSDATGATYLCELAGPGQGGLGDSCYPDGNDACATSLCLLESGGGPGMQYCSQACRTDTDCDNDPVNWRCAAIQIRTPYGYSALPVCVKR